jgi:pentatricopeptide repeat protein
MDIIVEATQEYLAGRLGEAERLCKAALAQSPENVGALNLLGLIAADVGRYAIGASLLAKAVNLEDHNPALYNNLGNILAKQGREKEAEACFRQSIALDSAYAEPYNALAGLCGLAGRYDEALDLYRQAIKLSPSSAALYANLGHVLFAMGESATAEAEFRRSLGLAPFLDHARSALALCLLDRGELAEGWELYEARLGTERSNSAKRVFPMPSWQGEDLSGKTIMVWREEGVGDEIKFASCLPDLASLDGRVIFEASQRLVSLYARSFPDIEIRAENLAGGDYDGVDFHLPIGSLPKYFRREFAQFPAKSDYLKPEPERVEFWRQRLAKLGGGRKIGICWRSQNRSIFKNPFNAAIADLGELFKLPGIVWVNLQYDDCAAELAEIKSSYGLELQLWPDLDLKNDFENVAALIAALDGVAGARTTVAALAGALGVPCLMYATTPNVLALGREIDPWFPATRIFTRRRDEDWTRVMGEIAKHMTQRALR